MENGRWKVTPKQAKSMLWALSGRFIEIVGVSGRADVLVVFVSTIC